MTDSTPPPNEPPFPPASAAESPDPNPGDPVTKPTLDPMETPSRAIRPRGIEEAKRLATVAARVAIENRGRDVVVLDVSNQSAEFDYFVLVTGTSRRQLHAISEEIDDALEKGLGERRRGIEGYQESNWIVLDYATVVVHLFDEQTREYYDLESLWADGKPVSLSELGLTLDGGPAEQPSAEDPPS